MNKDRFIACLAFSLAVLSALSKTTADELNWDQALVRGTTPNGKIVYSVGEEMTFMLRLEGVKGEVPADVYFLDWRRCGDDGKTEAGRAPLPIAEPFIYRTQMDRPGFVFLEANVVTADGKLVPKNHRWEKRVFFGGGVAVEPERLADGGEPEDYAAFWQSVLQELSEVPIKSELKPVYSMNPEVEISAFRIDCAGGFPVTGYISIPKDVAEGKTYRIVANFRGAGRDCMPVQETGPLDAIWAIININGYELGRDDAYYKEFFAKISERGYGYGFGPEGNKSRQTSYWKGAAMRDIRFLQWLKTIKGWNGEDLVLSGGSQGDWQSIVAAAWVPGVTRILANGPWGCDWTGQERFGRIKSAYRPKCWFPDMAYFDAVFAAKRISCPVEIAFAGLGDYVSPPSSITVLYNNLRGPKKLTYVQGSSHGWRPKGEQSQTIDGGYDEAVLSAKPLDAMDYVRSQLEKGVRDIRIPSGTYRLDLHQAETRFLSLKGISNVTLDFASSTLLGSVNTCFFGLSECTNVTIRNVTIDYAPLPFTQAEIVSVDEKKNWTVRIIDGYPAPSDEAVAQHGRFWPIQVYDRKTHDLKNPMRFRDGIAIKRVDARVYRIEGGLDRRGDVGDIAVWSVPETTRKVDDNVFSISRCVSCRFENITIYSTPKGCAFAEIDSRASAYVNCVLDRCPEAADYETRGLMRLRSGNHDALNARCATVGPTVDSCRFRYHCDDCVNISGYYALVVRQEGRRLRVAPFSGVIRIREGESCQLMTYEGACPQNATAVSVRLLGGTTKEERKTFESYNLWPMIASWATKAYEIELDREVALPPGSVIISNDRMGNGFAVCNCDFGPNRARGIIVRASDGVIESNRLSGIEGWGVQLAPGFEWMEGGCSRSVLIRNNVITSCGAGISVSGNNGARKPLPVTAHKDIAVCRNVVASCAAGIEIVGCSELSFKDNELREIGNPKRVVYRENVSE